MVVLVQVGYELVRKKPTFMCEQFPTLAFSGSTSTYTTHTIKPNYIWDLTGANKQKNTLTEVRPTVSNSSIYKQQQQLIIRPKSLNPGVEPSWLFQVQFLLNLSLSSHSVWAPPPPLEEFPLCKPLKRNHYRDQIPADLPAEISISAHISP